MKGFHTRCYARCVGRYSRRMPALTEIFGDDSVLQFGGGPLGHQGGNAPGAVANRPHP